MLQRKLELLLQAQRNVDYGPDNKRLFHGRARRFLKELANKLNIQSYDLRSNPGGPAVIGEITLHSDSSYVQIFREGVMYRTCKGRRDYCGGQNHFTSIESLGNQAVIDKMRLVLGLTNAAS